MKKGPEQSVDEPSPFAVREFLPRQDIATPPELLTDDTGKCKGNNARPRAAQ